MTTECPILIGVFNGFSWIRCEGKGSFLNSPLLKQFGDARITAGERCLVVDLEACTGMDSTFMGTLAGMAARVTSHEGGALQIADAGARNSRSLEDLGLDFLIEINPPTNGWRDTITTIRAALKPPQPLVAPGVIQRAEHVLEAHQILSGANDKNARVFANVVTLLQEDLAEKSQKSAGPGPG